MRGDRVRTPQSQKWPAPVPLPGAAYPDWEAIYADNVGRIYRLMFSKVGNRPDAEDLTSQVFLTAYGPLRTTAGVAQVRAYLTATARTVLAEHWRRTLGHQVTEIDLETTDLENYAGASTGAGVGLGSGNSGADERAARILEALPQRQRQILILRFLRGYSIRQAAAELGVTVANAKVLQHRALRAAVGMEDSRGEQVDGAGSGKRVDGAGGGERAAGLRASGKSGREAKRELEREAESSGRPGRDSVGESGQGSESSGRPGRAPVGGSGRELRRGSEKSGHEPEQAKEAAP